MLPIENHRGDIGSCDRVRRARRSVGCNARLPVLAETVVEQDVDEFERLSKAVCRRTPTPSAVAVIRIIAIPNGPVAIIRVRNLIALCTESVIELDAIAAVGKLPRPSCDKIRHARIFRGESRSVCRDDKVPSRSDAGAARKSKLDGAGELPAAQVDRG